ncbi:MAG TPA: PKD domain-containing protein, partial [Nakamurella sp.]
LRTTADPVTLDGTVIRVDPLTGAGAAGNPLAGSGDPNARRIIANGLRNPFRFTFRPGTDELWLGDVGWGDWEEINRITDPVGGVSNFGWPCYEGSGRQSGYDGANLNLCENLYAAGPGAVTDPHFRYHHSNRVVVDETCPTGSSSVAGLAFEFAGGGTYPDEYADALFFADYSRDCIWVMPKGANGVPAPGQIRTFVAGAANPVNLETGPGGDLFYVDFDGGTVRRISHTASNTPPIAALTATPIAGAEPLTVQFDATGSTDPDGDTISFAWDLNGDGTFGDAVGNSQVSYTYTQPGTYAATVRVTDTPGAHATGGVTIRVGNTAPVVTMTSPVAGLTWRVGDVINFSGSATDAEDGPLPPSALTWKLVMNHCPSNCHTHPVQEFTGVGSGSFVAPDHEYPSYLELTLAATDSGGLTSTVTRRLDPRTVTLTFQTTPGGMKLTVNATEQKASFTRTVIIGSTNTVSAITPQQKGPKNYTFQSWSEGGAQTHTIVAPANATTYSARYR